MINKAIKFLTILIIVFAALYIVQQNPDQITVRLSSDTEWQGNQGTILISVFVLGFSLMAVISGYFALKSFLRERRLEKIERKRQNFFEAMVQARSYLAVGDWARAREAWERMISRDPSNIIARVELSKSLEGNGDLLQALKVVDEARAADPANVEVLFRAAQLNLALNNKTAAVDNLALILYHHPNVAVAAQARDLSEELGRIEDAIEYQTRVEQLGAETSPEIVARLRYHRLLAEYNSEESKAPKALRDALTRFVKKYPKFVPALHKLALLDSADGRIDAAAQRLVEAAKLSGAAKYWQDAVTLWLDNDMAGNAISAAKTATKNTKGVARLSAELDLVRLQIALNMLEEARTAVDGFYALAREQKVEVPAEMAQNLLVLKGLCLNRLGKYRDAAEVWKQLSQYDFDLRMPQLEERKVLLLGDAPAPRLSTP